MIKRHITAIVTRSAYSTGNSRLPTIQNPIFAKKFYWAMNEVGRHDPAFSSYLIMFSTITSSKKANMKSTVYLDAIKGIKMRYKMFQRGVIYCTTSPWIILGHPKIFIKWA